MNSGHQAWHQTPLPLSHLVVPGPEISCQFVLSIAEGINSTIQVVSRSIIDRGRREEWPGGIDMDTKQTPGSSGCSPGAGGPLCQPASTGSTHSKRARHAPVIPEWAISLGRCLKYLGVRGEVYLACTSCWCQSDAVYTRCLLVP